MLRNVHLSFLYFILCNASAQENRTHENIDCSRLRGKLLNRSFNKKCETLKEIDLNYEHIMNNTINDETENLLNFSFAIGGNFTDDFNRSTDDNDWIKNEYKSNGKETRSKRGLIQLYNMVSCATGCDPLSYKGYGCYCGFLGSGIVTDSIDRCCMYHDFCYSAINCPPFFVYFMPYLWKCWNGEPLCAVDHHGFGGPGSCAARLCECDRELAVCLSESPCPTRRAICTSSPLRFLQNIILY